MSRIALFKSYKIVRSYFIGHESLYKNVLSIAVGFVYIRSPNKPPLSIYFLNYSYKFLVMHRLLVLMPLTLLLVSSPVSTDRVLLESCKQMLKLLFRPCNRPSSLQRDPPIPPPPMSER